MESGNAQHAGIAHNDANLAEAGGRELPPVSIKVGSENYKPETTGAKPVILNLEMKAFFQKSGADPEPMEAPDLGSTPIQDTP
jgi:hypothetical protein